VAPSPTSVNEVELYRLTTNLKQAEPEESITADDDTANDDLTDEELEVLQVTSGAGSSPSHLSSPT